MMILCIAAVALFSLMFRIASVLRLVVPLLYALIVPTLFQGWYYSHYTLANSIWYGILALVALSWVVTLVQRVRELF